MRVIENSCVLCTHSGVDRYCLLAVPTLLPLVIQLVTLITENGARKVSSITQIFLSPSDQDVEIFATLTV